MGKGANEMSEMVSEYDAKVDNKKRLTLRETPFEYYHVEHYSDRRIMLAPRELVAPVQISTNTLEMMDSSMSHLKEGQVSPPIDLSIFEG